MLLTPKETRLPWLNGFVDENGAHYGRTAAGNVDLGSLALIKLNQQSQYVSRYIDGLLPGYPALGVGLEIEGSSLDYHAMGVNPEHAAELVERIVAYQALAQHVLIENGKSRRPTEDELAGFADYLRQRDLPLPEDIR